MAGIRLTKALRTEYELLFNGCVVKSNRTAAVQRLVNRLLSNRARYQGVEKFSGVPWYFIAVIHNMESSQNFRRHLHNGDSLTARTVHVPTGRPKNGTPPFTWEFSAADALAYERLGDKSDWSLAGVLHNIEGYNGWGYRRFHPQTLSPYLWGYSNHYISGKYVKDGLWSDTAVSDQCGAAVLLRRMAELGQVTLVPKPAPGPSVPSYSNTKSSHPAVVAQVVALQTWLNTFPHIFIREDGVPGRRTSDAYKQATGRYLPGDPG